MNRGPVRIAARRRESAATTCRLALLRDSDGARRTALIFRPHGQHLVPTARLAASSRGSFTQVPSYDESSAPRDRPSDAGER